MDIKISKIKIRRGTHSQVKSVVLDQGEIAYSTDTRRIYVGNGSLSGGTNVANKINTPITNVNSLTSIVSEIGDITTANNKFYQLIAQPHTTLANWSDIGTKINSQYFSYDATNRITLKSGSISASNIDIRSIGDGLKVDSGKIQSNFSTQNFEISAEKLKLKNSGVNEFNIASTSFNTCLSGGSGGKIGLRFDPSTFYLNSGILSLSSTGNGVSVDNITLTQDISGKISMVGGITPQTSELSRIRVDEFGRIRSQSSSIFDVLTGNSSLNSTNSLSSIFNGTPSHTLSGGIPGLTITRFEGISSNGVTTTTVTLSSAGFIAFEGGYQARSGQPVGRFAIPIFAY